MIWCYVIIFDKTQKKQEVENVIKKHAKMGDTELNEEERADFFMQYFNDSDADEEFEGFDEFNIAENIEIVCGINIEQAENDRDIRDDVEVGWSREDAVPLIGLLSTHTLAFFL